MQPIAIDIETFAITPTDPCPQLVCMSYALDATTTDIARHEHAPEVFRTIAEDPESLVVTHNGPYDVTVLLKADPSLAAPILKLYDEGRIADTMIREALAHIERGTLQEESEWNKGLLQLATLANDHLGIQLDKGEDSWRLRYGEFFDVPLEQWPAEARHYATADAACTLRVYQDQKPKPDEVLQVRAALALKLMSNHGAVTDEEAVDRFETSVLERALKHEASLRECGLIKTRLLDDGNRHEDDGKRDTKLARAFVEDAYMRMGLPVPLTDPSDRFPYGQTRYDELTLSESGDARLVALSDYARALKLLETYVPIMRSGLDHPIYGKYNTLVATGRTSAYKPNWQNLPVAPGARECVRARKGRVLVACDMSLAELRTLAQVTFSWFGFSVMRDALLEGKDLHTDLGASILGIPYAEAAALKKAKDLIFVGTDDQPGIRSIAKNMNFGLAGGLGAETFSAFLRNNGIRKTRDECAVLKMQWLDKWTEMRPYFDHMGKVCGDFGTKSLTQFGSERVRGGLSFTQAANTMFQGYVADIAKAWMWRVTRACYWEDRSPLFGSRPIFFIHDELILESDEEAGHDVAVELERLAVETMAEWMPDVPGLADAHLMYHWTKKAEATKDKHGRLIPWEKRAA